MEEKNVQRSTHVIYFVSSIFVCILSSGSEKANSFSVRPSIVLILHDVKY